MRIFLDIDNTIIEHSGFYTISTENRIHKSIGRFPNENETAITSMYDSSVCSDPVAVKNLFFSEGVYILTKYPHIDFEKHKKKRIAGILGISVEELTNLKDENGVAKYIALNMEDNKSDTIKEMFKIKDISDCILVDDYSANIIEWEQAGGIGFKYYNEYNNSRHPMNGITISNFKLLHNLVNQNKKTRLFLVGNNKYKLKLLEQQFECSQCDVQIIQIINYIIKDLQEKIGFEDFSDNHKYSYIDFIVDYYNFVDRADSAYWTKAVRKDVNNSKSTIFSSVFEPNFTSIFKHTELHTDELLTINLLSATNETKQIFDIYLTIDERLIIEDIEDEFKNIVDKLTMFIR